MSDVPLADELIEAVRDAAEHEGIGEADFVSEAVRRHLAVHRQKRISAETEAWYRMPAHERQRFAGQFVAVVGGQVVDQDADRLALLFRVREKHRRRPVVIVEGGDQPMPVYQVHSPRRG